MVVTPQFAGEALLEDVAPEFTNVTVSSHLITGPTRCQNNIQPSAEKKKTPSHWSGLPWEGALY